MPNGTPTVVSDSGFNWVSGFGSNINVDCGGGVLATEAGGYTIFIVAKRFADDTNSVVLSSQGTFGGDAQAVVVIADSNQSGKSYLVIGHESEAYDVVLTAEATELNTPLLFTAGLTADTTTSIVRVTPDAQINTPYSNSGSPASFLSHLIVGAYVVFPGTTWFNGEIAEVLVYQRGLTPTEITQAQNYLNTKYGI